MILFHLISRVCKTWRSLALCNKMFMASKPPMLMLMRISNHRYKKKWYCYLEDIEGRKFRTTIPYYADRVCVGLTCGYFILFGRKTCNFFLVNPITRYELHFPNASGYLVINNHGRPIIKAILVFSCSISRWIFIVFDIYAIN